MIHQSIELRYASVALFFDAGSAWEPGDTAQARYSTGVGLHGDNGFITLAFPLNSRGAGAIFMMGVKYGARQRNGSARGSPGPSDPGGTDSSTLEGWPLDAPRIRADGHAQAWRPVESPRALGGRGELRFTVRTLRSQLIVAFVVATLVPLGAAMWIASSLLDRSLGFATTQDLDALSRRLEDTGRLFYQREREAHMRDVRAGHSAATHSIASVTAWPDAVRAFWDSDEPERVILAGAGGGRLDFLRRTSASGSSKRSIKHTGTSQAPRAFWASSARPCTSGCALSGSNANRSSRLLVIRVA